MSTTRPSIPDANQVESPSAITDAVRVARSDCVNAWSFRRVQGASLDLDAGAGDRAAPRKWRASSAANASGVSIPCSFAKA